MALSFSLPRLPYRDDSLFSLTILTVVCVTLGFSQFFTEGFESVKLTLWLLGAGGLWMCVFFARRIRVVVQPLLGWLLALTVLWFGFGAFAGNDIIQSLFGGAGRYTMSFLAFCLWALFIIVASGDWSGRSDKQLFVVKTVAWLGGIVALFSILQQFGIGYYPGASASFHFLVPGFLGNQNFTGMYLVGVVPVVWWLWGSSRGWSRVVYGILQTLIVWELALTSSRGALVALLAAYGAWCVVLVVAKQWRVLMTLFTASLLVAVFVTSQFSPLLRNISLDTNLKANANSATVDNRKGIWLDSLHIITEHPWLGIGGGNALTMPQPLVFLSNVTVERFDDVHNIVLNIGLAGGIPLVLLFVLFVGGVLWRATVVAWCERDILVALVIIAALTLLLAAMFNPLVLPCWLLLALWLAWLLARVSVVDELLLSGWRRAVVGGVAGLVILYAVCFISSTWLSVQAESAYKQQHYDRSLVLARRSVTVLPWNTEAGHFVVMSLYQQYASRPELLSAVSALTRWHSRFPGQLQERAQLYYKLYQRFGLVADREQMNSALSDLAQLDPYTGFTYSFAANLYLQTGQLDKAFAAASQYLSTPQRRNVYSWLLLAQIQLARGQRVSAEIALRNAYKVEAYPTELRTAVGELVRVGLAGVTTLPFVFATQ